MLLEDTVSVFPTPTHHIEYYVIVTIVLTVICPVMDQQPDDLSCSLQHGTVAFSRYFFPGMSL